MSSQSGFKMLVDITDIQQRFQQYDIRNSKTNTFPDNIYPQLKRASVLVPIFFKNGHWRILLTIRSHKLKTHAGNVALPGGVWQESDADNVITALREAEEEVGLRKESVQVLAVLFPSFVRPGYIVFPVVGVIPSWFVAEPNHEEVSLVFDLPLDTFLSDPIFQNWTFFGVDTNIVHFPCVVNNVKIDIWGFTASVCMLTCYVVYNNVKRFNLLKRWKQNDNDDIYGPLRFVFNYLCQQFKPRM